MIKKCIAKNDTDGLVMYDTNARKLTITDVDEMLYVNLELRDSVIGDIKGYAVRLNEEQMQAMISWLSNKLTEWEDMEEEEE